MSLTHAMRLQYIQDSKQNNYFNPATLKEIKKTTKNIKRSLGEMTHHIDKLSIHLQELKNELVSYTE